MELETKLSNLSHTEKMIIYILSIGYIPMNQTQLMNLIILNNIKIDGQNLGKVKAQGRFRVFKPTLDKLIASGFLMNSNRSRIQIKFKMAELITRKAVAEGLFEPFAKHVVDVLNLSEEKLINRTTIDSVDLIAAIRILIYQKNADHIMRLYKKHITRITNPLPLRNMIEMIVFTPFDKEWAEVLPGDVISDFFMDQLEFDIKHWKNRIEYFDFIEELALSAAPNCLPELQSAIVDRWVVTNNTSHIKAWLELHKYNDSENKFCLQGFQAFMKGKNNMALELYEAGLLMRKQAGKSSRTFFDSFTGIFYILALFKDNTASCLEKAEGYLKSINSSLYMFHTIYKQLSLVLQMLKGHAKASAQLAQADIYYSEFSSTDAIGFFFRIFCCYWADERKAKKSAEVIADWITAAKQNQYIWFSQELSLLKKELSRKNKSTSSINPSIHLIGVVSKAGVWEQTLDELLALKSPKRSTAKKKESKLGLRMVWFVSCDGHGNFYAGPREQKINAKGAWTKGRPIALKRLYTDLNQFPYISDQDRDVCRQIETYSYKDGWYTQTEYGFNDKYVDKLIGHPLLFSDDTVTPVELVKGKPELQITKNRNGSLSLKLIPAAEEFKENDYYVLMETATRMKAIRLDEEYHRIAAILGEGIMVPPEGKDRVLEVIEKLAGDIFIRSDIGGKSKKTKHIKADGSIHLLLTPHGNGLKLTAYVQPLGVGDSYHHPGTGGKTLIAEISGKQLQTTRNLDKEKQAVNELIQACPTIQEFEQDSGEWIIAEPYDCLEVLSELEEIRSSIVLEWPEGETFKLAGKVSLKQLHLNIKQQQDWFEATGSLNIDGKRVLDMQQLLTLLEDNSSRFIEIKDRQFLALTDQFRKKTARDAALQQCTWQGDPVSSSGSSHA